MADTNRIAPPENGTSHYVTPESSGLESGFFRLPPLALKNRVGLRDLRRLAP